MESFNPHRLRRAGATIHGQIALLEREVSILTGSEEPVQPSGGRRPRTRRSCFNPHRLRRAGATRLHAHLGVRPPAVSILTGSEEPVQL